MTSSLLGHYCTLWLCIHMLRVYWDCPWVFYEMKAEALVLRRTHVTTTNRDDVVGKKKRGTNRFPDILSAAFSLLWTDSFLFFFFFSWFRWTCRKRRMFLLPFMPAGRRAAKIRNPFRFRSVSLFEFVKPCPEQLFRILGRAVGVWSKQGAWVGVELTTSWYAMVNNSVIHGVSS